MATKDIKFWRGRQADYDKLTPQDNIIYFILDEFKIYLGGVEVSNNKEYFIGTLMSRFNNIIDIFTWDRSDPIEPPKPTYDTDKTYMTFTATDNQTIDLSSYMDGITNVNWGDGAVDTNKSHVYAKGGDYDVIITHSADTSFGWNSCRYLKEVKSIGKLNTNSFFVCFNNCVSLTTIHPGLFDNNVNVTDFSNCFGYCISLSSIPQGLFDNNVNVTDFSRCFYNCSSLTTIPQGLFDNNVNVTTFYYCFYNCSSLTTIPQGLFDKNVNVTDFNSCFYNCSSLTTIPVGLFDKNVNVTNFNSCFNQCSSLTTIPVGLFDKNVNVTYFSYCFYQCSSLTSIPQGLFDNNVNVTSFSGCFSDCSKLTTIPTGLFDKHVNVTNFSYCFRNCSSLTTIPQGLFDNNVNVTDFWGCFYNCSSLNHPYNLTSPELPKLWERDGTNGAVTVTSYSQFASSANSTFSASVPISWGGTMVPEPPKPTYEPDKTYMVFTVTDNQSIDLSSKMNGITNVNWGDGTVDANTSHVYTTAGDYDVIITHTEASSFSFIGTQFLKEIKSLGILSKVDWEDTFRYCVSLLRIHNTAFNNCIGVTVFRGCFNSCRSLASIPAGLFDKNVNVINFRDCFGNCNSLTTIPAGLFDKCVNVTDFSGCFINCGNLSSIPAGLFDNNDNVTDLSSCFNACNSLTTIPAGLFDKCVNVTDFRGCFFSCQSLNQPYNLTSPELPKLWERDGTNGAVTVTSYSQFASKAHATFKESVPVEWGGTMTQTRTVKPIVLAAITPTPNDVEFNNTNSTIFTIGVKDNETIECGGPNTMYIDWGDGVVDGSDGKTIKHTYNKGGDYIVKINHDSTANLAIPNNIKTIHNIGDITDLSYVFMFKTNLTKIDTGAFDNCKSVNNLSNCFDGCRFLNHAYNLTSQGLKKLWERDGDSDGVRIENYDMFGENTGTLFANTIPSEWGGNL